ncbi:TRAP transporter small permease subunit [Rhodoligotrophos defluvii]|uniref:TRAP transporter small permease subunit n=1 Tax=Rhodoligotrophos defluvii TaxID=2561934 RepID=UPI001EEFC91D|nr:TRAP transporter small permease subunit [Rhodoligotrophos defluvii]
MLQSSLLRISHAIDLVNDRIGRLVTWAILVAILVSAANAVSRRFFGMSSNAWLELQWYLFGAVVLLCAAWALKEKEHVAVDLLTARLPPRRRTWLMLLGHVLFLLPFATLMVWLSVPYAVASFASGEVSLNPGGLVVWPAKALIAAGFVTLLLQCLSEIIKCVAILGNFPGAPSADETARPGAPIAEQTVPPAIGPGAAPGPEDAGR